jgi:DNA topoisomerase VI subunit B
MQKMGSEMADDGISAFSAFSAPNLPIRAEHRLERETFKTSRLLDFCSARELTKQIGHGVAQWPLVILKEPVDNALDAAEEASIAPAIGVEVADGTITITDNGPGIPAETVAGVLDFSVRVSSREAYASPTRGAQGNALKTIVAMAFALDGAKGETVIESRGTRHQITFKVEHIRHQPKLDHACSSSDVKIGTRVTVRWPVCASSKLDEAKSQFLQMADDFGWLNPHLSISAIWNSSCCVDFAASNRSWQKWQPHYPTSPHWYDPARLRRLMGAYIARDQDQGREPRTVREFISEFRGLSGSAKQKLVLEEVGASRLSLPEFFGTGDQVNTASIAMLLAAMQQHTKAVKPQDLGIIGKEHFASRFQTAGADLEAFWYRRNCGDTDGIPDVIETAFGWCPKGECRRIITGVNWSPTIGNPFRSIGGESLDTILANQRCNFEEPIIFVLHLARPRIDYTDHGKTAIALNGGGDDDE